MTPKPAAHTPTPWKVDDGDNDIHSPSGELIACAYGMQDANKKIVHNSETLANAAFIVRAVNAHDELLKVVKDFYRAASAIMSTLPEDAAMNYAMRDAANAIARAEGVK